MVKVILLAVFVLGIGAIEAAFDRQCDGSHCKFQGQVWLACTPDNTKCACDRYRYIADVPAWNLEMKNGQCQIATSGPCGVENGLEIGCQGDDTCVEGRCRNSAALGTGDLYNSCNGDIDCLPTLRCKVVGFYYHKLMGCLAPETPPYDPATQGFGHIRNKGSGPRPTPTPPPRK